MAVQNAVVVPAGSGVATQSSPHGHVDILSKQIDACKSFVRDENSPWKTGDKM